MVKTEQGYIEGYVHLVPNPHEVYVVLAGQNTKPVLVDAKTVRSLDAPIPKRKRGRPRKEK